VLAADEQGGIGKNNDLPWPALPADLRHFRDITSSTLGPGRRNAVIMGRKTWDSIPPKYRPLPNRLNVVISRSRIELPELELPETTGWVGSLEDALTYAWQTVGIENVFIVGGGEIYRQAFEHPDCHDIFLTRIHDKFDCDTFVPNVEEHFALATTLSEHHDGGCRYTIEHWLRRG